MEVVPHVYVLVLLLLSPLLCSSASSPFTQEGVAWHVKPQ